MSYHIKTDYSNYFNSKCRDSFKHRLRNSFIRHAKTYFLGIYDFFINMRLFIYLLINLILYLIIFQSAPAFFPGGKESRGVKFTTHSHLVTRLSVSAAATQLSLRVCLD